MTGRILSALVFAALPLAGASSGARGEGGAAAQAGPFDVLVRGGQVVDGSGAAAVRADVGIAAGRIRAIGRLDGATAPVVIDAGGRVVTPGFIDVHSHASGGLGNEALKQGQPLLAQGITTAILNPDGGGPTDLAQQSAIYGKQGIGVNVAQFIGHGSIRQAVMGMTDRDPDAAQLARMVEMTAQGMTAGAVGLSSGLYYAPGSYSKTDEVIAMAKATAPHGVYASHIRDEGDYNVGVVAAVDEVIAIAEGAGITGVVTHMKALGPPNWGLAKTMIDHIEKARARKVRVFADQYPYEASGTSIVGALIPRSAQVGGREALMKRIKGELRGEIREAVKANITRRGGADTFLIADFEPDPSLEGQRLSDLAARAGLAPEEYALTLLERGGAGLVSFNMAEPDIELIMKQPWVMTCTDGGLQPMDDGKPHPRAYGAFPRKLQRYVRERGTVSLPFAIRSMTALPAEVFGLKDRGVLRVGAHADVLIFDPAAVREASTYAQPHQLAEGIADIIVNGEVVRRGGAFTAALPGRVLKPER